MRGPTGAQMGWEARVGSVTQFCPTLCSPMDCSPPGSCPWGSPGKNTGVGCCPGPVGRRGGHLLACILGMWEVPMGAGKGRSGYPQD